MLQAILLSVALVPGAAGMLATKSTPVAPPYVECPSQGVAQNELPCPGAPGDVPLPGKSGTREFSCFVMQIFTNTDAFHLPLAFRFPIFEHVASYEHQTQVI
jgi:hypothetical protein